MHLPALRSRLVLLAFGSMLPLVLLSVLLATLVFQRENNLVRDGAMDRARAIASAVDASLDGHFAVLRALASMEALEQGDLATFSAAVTRVKAAQPLWRNVLLLDAQGRHRMNLRAAASDDLPRALPADLPSLEQVLATGQAHVGNVGPGPLTGYLAIPLQIRVKLAGEAMVLKLILEPEAFASLLATQRLPGKWAVAIVDGNGNFVARVPYRTPGEPAAAALRQALKEFDSGWMRLPTLEHTDAHQAFVHSASSSWSVGVAVPRAEVLAGVRRAALWLLLGIVISLALAGVLTLCMSRRIASPIHRLARAAREVGTGNLAALQEVQRRPGFAEAAEVAHALEQAAASMGERELLQQREQLALREADRAKDEFLAMLGHELRNPLSAITSSAQVLRRAPAGAGSADRAHAVIERQTRQMTRLVEDLLDISRLATGKLRLELELLNLAALVATAIEVWQQTAAREGKALRFQGSPAWARVDRARVEQILINLIDNALKFSLDGAAVDVSVRTEGTSAVLEVRDNGRGIRAEDLPLIFNTFHQGDQSLHRPQGGMGLGLSLVKRLAELHGGQVSAYSEGEGRGARFEVRLPLAATPQPPVPMDGAEDAAPRLRILLVEDNDDGRAMLELVLQMESHDVRSTRNGLDALALLATWQADVALIDIGLPDIDGHEVALRIAALEIEPPPRLIAMSGFGQPEDKLRSARAGFELHLTKPVNSSVLAGVLKKMMAADAGREPGAGSAP